MNVRNTTTFQLYMHMAQQSKAEYRLFFSAYHMTICVCQSSLFFSSLPENKSIIIVHFPSFPQHNHCIFHAHVELSSSIALLFATIRQLEDSLAFCRSFICTYFNVRRDGACVELVCIFRSDLPLCAIMQFEGNVINERIKITKI